MTRAEKKQISLMQGYRERTGIRIAEMEDRAVPAGDKLAVCLTKGFLIFLTCYGLNMLFITSFDLPCSRIIIGFSALFLSMFVSLFYYRKLFFNLGYIVLFLFFLPISLGLVVFANSGINAVTNILMEAVDAKLNLGGVRVYQEFYTNRYLTITCCLFLLLFMEVCLFNALISEYMSGIVLFLITFPVIEVCMYLCDSVSYVYVAMTIFPCIFCMVMKHSKRFRLGLTKRTQGFSLRKKVVSFRPFPKREGIVPLVTYGAAAFAILFLVSFLLLRVFPYRSRNNISEWKKSTDSSVAEFAMHGIAGYFNSYEGRGGVGGGRLGGIREVTLDFETDLLVQYVPYSSAPVYLKAFTYNRYIKNSWRNDDKRFEELLGRYFEKNPEAVSPVYLESAYLSGRFQYGEHPSAYALMRVKPVDYAAKQMMSFVPNYETDPDLIREDSPVTERYRKLTESPVVGGKRDSGFWDSVFYPLLSEQIAVEAKQTDPERELYRQYVYEDYLEVPAEIQRTVDQICTEQGFSGTPLEIVSQIQKYFRDNFQYTLAPGKTPNSRDFVVYFLTKQKKGYCTHFATAGAMLLRNMGIPARYAEGYCIDIATAADASDIIEGEVAGDWYAGDNLLASDIDETYVIEVEVNDSNAHAWVEIYIDGFGWIPVELTTGWQAESSEEDDFWSNFGRLLTGDENESPIQILTAQAGRVGIGLLVIFLVGIAAGVLILIIGYTVRRIRLYHIRSNKRLSNQYVLLNKLLNRYYFNEQTNVFHTMSVEIGRNFGLNEAELREYASLTERASYGRNPLSKEELGTATELFRKYVAGIRASVKGIKKLWIILQT